MKEGQPNGYQFKHNTSISLDQYRGIASDIMQVNDPVADGFMSRADMRANIQVTTKTPGRTREYDQLGNVRVGKMLNIPKLEVFKQGQQRAFKDGSSWVVQVDDQKIGDKVVREDKKGKKFDEAFTAEFQQELRKGILECLKKEKLLNNGQYDEIFYTSYLFFCLNNIVPITQIGNSIARGEASAYSITSQVMVPFLINTSFNAARTIAALAVDKQSGDLRRFIPEIPTIVSQEPFVRRDILEAPLPLVPFDRFARGWVYLKRHGNELIQTTDKTNLNIPDS